MSQREQLDAVEGLTQKTQMSALLGFKQMENTIEKLEQQTRELATEKEQEAAKLKEQAKNEAQMKAQIDQTARAAIKARKLQNKML